MQNIHPLYEQLLFTRKSFLACLGDVPEIDAIKRINQLNCLSWIIGHLANQEHRYWIQSARGIILFPQLNELVGYGRPASTPPLEEMLGVWKKVTTEANKYLETINSEKLADYFQDQSGKQLPESIGTMLHRNIYHYWYHIGEAHTIREMLGHSNLPEYVGDMSTAVYKREES
jgi:hypothetical protein